VKTVRLAALIATCAVSAAVPSQALAAGSPSSQITPTPPSRLSPPKSTTPGSLPDTGLNLLPETIAGVALLGAGVGLRARRSRA
jgi:hypothetical protein